MLSLPEDENRVADANGWYPIDTAPKDGSWVWVTEDSGTWMDMVRWRNGHWSNFQMSVFHDASHWRPLPQPPITESRENARELFSGRR